MSRSTALLIVLTLVTACQKGSPQPRTNDSVDAGYSNRLEALSVPERNATFGRAIRDAGLTCQWVVRSDALNKGSAQPAWRARCMEGQFFDLALRQGGMLQVTGPLAVTKGK